MNEEHKGEILLYQTEVGRSVGYDPNTPESVEFLKGIPFENEYKFFKRQIAEFFEVTERTIDNCLEKKRKRIVQKRLRGA